ncbi:MAG TPA: hypothetical protein VM099_16330 [Gemmatimonadaceae bacterium]|nr:hypothetical protein [Gemmatimonadaceae bacterium]
MSTKRDFPHPVLDPTGKDYPDCGFQTALIVEQRQNDFCLDASFDIGSQSVEGLVNRGKAQYVLQVHCPRTAFRRAFGSKKRSWDMQIEESLLRDSFSVTPQVVSVDDFSYTSKEFAPIFRGMKFDIRRGYVLAIGQTLEYPADKDVDDLNRLGAIFQVIRNKKKTAEFAEYDLEGPKILVLLPPEQYARYDLYKARQPYMELLVTSLILPGLTLAIDYMKTNRLDAGRDPGADGDSAQRWIRCLEKRLEQLGIDGYDTAESFVIAQRILENPVGRAFAAIDDRESKVD